MIYFVRFLSSATWSCFYPFMAIWLNAAVGLSTSAAGIVAEATAAVLGLLAVAQELSFMSFLLGFAACVIAALGAWVSIALKRPLIGIDIEQRSAPVS